MIISGEKITQDFITKGYSLLKIEMKEYNNILSVSKKFHSLPIYEKMDCRSSDDLCGLGFRTKELLESKTKNYLNNRVYSSFDYLNTDSAISNKIPLFKQDYWPENKKVIKEIEKTYEEVQLLSKKVSIEILRNLGLSNTDQIINNNISIARLLEYNLVDYTSKDHTDYELISLIFSSCDGLQVKSNMGKYEFVYSNPNEIIILPGDMIQVLSKGKIKSTMHRVISAKVPRYCYVFFQGVDFSTPINYDCGNYIYKNTFGGHLIGFLARGCKYSDKEIKKLEEYLNCDILSSNPFKNL